MTTTDTTHMTSPDYNTTTSTHSDLSRVTRQYCSRHSSLGEWPVLGNIDNDYLSSVQSSNYNQFMIMQINPDYNEHYQLLVQNCKGWDDLKASLCIVCVLMTDGVLFCCFNTIRQIH